MIAEFSSSSVLNFYQDQTMRRRGEPGEASIAFDEKRLKFVKANGSSSHLQ